MRTTRMAKMVKVQRNIKRIILMTIAAIDIRVQDKRSIEEVVILNSIM
ncbi:MAG: hypothetical protein ABR502_10745 [Chitinophagaceae bacterium]